MSDKTYFTVTLTDDQREQFGDMAMEVQATFFKSDRGVVFAVPSQDSDLFEQRVRELVGSRNYYRYDRLQPGFDPSDAQPVTNDILGRLLWR